MDKSKKDSLTCDISKVIPKDGKLPPLLISFQHGALIPEESASLECIVSHNKFVQKRKVSIATRDRNIYVGSGDTLNEESNTADICNTFIAIRNRKTNKIRLVESDNFILSPLITKQRKLSNKSNDVEKLSVEERYTDLHRSFGSKKSKRQTEQQQRYKTNVNTLEDKLTEVVDRVDAKHLRDDEAVSTSSLLIPPCNRDARVVEDVYDLHDIISKSELDSMADEAVKVIENFSVINISDFTVFFLENVPQVLESKERVVQRVEALLYADCIIKFFNAPFKGQALNTCCTFSKPVASKISQEFTMESNSRSRLRPLSMRDKALCHIIVLSLLTLNFKLNLKTITGSIKISQQRLSDFCRAIGTTYKKGEETIVLKLPLPPPPSLLINRKKRK